MEYHRYAQVFRLEEKGSKDKAQTMRDAGTAVSMIAKAFKVSRGTINNYTVTRKRR